MKTAREVLFFLSVVLWFGTITLPDVFKQEVRYQRVDEEATKRLREERQRVNREMRKYFGEDLSKYMDPQPVLHEWITYKRRNKHVQAVMALLSCFTSILFVVTLTDQPKEENGPGKSEEAVGSNPPRKNVSGESSC